MECHGSLATSKFGYIGSTLHNHYSSESGYTTSTVIWQCENERYFCYLHALQNLLVYMHVFLCLHMRAFFVFLDSVKQGYLVSALPNTITHTHTHMYILVNCGSSRWFSAVMLSW